MSISKRLIDLARSELNSLLERAGREEDEDDRENARPSGRGGGGASGDVSQMSDEELMAEIERRRRAREEVDEALHGKRRPPPPRSAPPPRSSPPRTAAGDDAIRKAYAALEVPAGSDFETVKKSYRRLMRKYHPDLHAGAPEKARAATDLTQRLTQAYKTLEKHLRR
ncbi:MAG TPA: J domain-containing protein, partial [Polyangia bacterium]|jgi:DnaJ-domain-containing protein 1